MGLVTKHALRVYASLAELKGGGDDVLDALIPFFEPILEVMDGKVFDPRLLALGVRRVYNWRFTKEIAEQFIPRLVRSGHLRREGTGRDAVYVVTFKGAAPLAENITVIQVLNEILDEFERFPALVTDLLHYGKSREELTDILIRFLVTTDAYGPAVGPGMPVAEDPLLAGLEEGGRPLDRDDRYMAARFVRYISEKDPRYGPHLARLASIGLLTEVVDDFLKPVSASQHSDLAIFVDAPLALDYLGLSGKELREDVRSVFDSLRGIGCKLVVFPITCEEMQLNLNSMLALPAPRRHGYTHEAMVRGEVMKDFVEAVARDPENALERAGIQVRPLTREQFPHQHAHFNDEQYEDFFSSVTWVTEVHPREHDTTCLALIMRLRQGRHHADVFKCGYIFVSRNPRFVRKSREYCIESRLITEQQEGPIIHQRELATVAWLRTGLGADASIPRMHLIAHCDRVLRVRPEVTEAVATRLKQVTPDKMEQYELLLLDHRSLRKLADQTLNDETVVTSENAERLLEVMRQATVEEERAKFETELEQQKARHRAQQRAAAARARNEIAQRDAYLEAKETKLAEEERRADYLQGALADTQRQREQVVDRVIDHVNFRVWLFEKFIVVALLLMVPLAAFEFFVGGLEGHAVWKAVVGLFGAAGIYYQAMDFLQKPKVGLVTFLNSFASRLLTREMARRGIDWLPADAVLVEKGRLQKRPD